MCFERNVKGKYQRRSLANFSSHLHLFLLHTRLGFRFVKKTHGSAATAVPFKYYGTAVHSHRVALKEDTHFGREREISFLVYHEENVRRFHGRVGDEEHIALDV